MGFHKALRKSARNKRLQKILEKTDIDNSLKYIKLLKEYSRYDHIRRVKELKIPVTIITTQSTFREVKKTAYNLTEALEKVQSICVPHRNHFIYVD
jgi:hypothetical protein